MTQARTTEKWRPLIFGLSFGIAFGFVLQKGGVGKFHILIGQLVLRDFTVIKVMMTAVAVGMVGVFLLRAAGRLTLKPQPTRYGANIIGGLIFGTGFALAAYCPGTNMVALGQGNYDALAVVAGLLLGSYLFALCSGRLNKTVMTWGDRGKVTVPELLHARATPVALTIAGLIGATLVLLEFVTLR